MHGAQSRSSHTDTTTAIAVEGEIPCTVCESHLVELSSYAVVTPAIRQKCYEAFKKTHGPKTSQILESFREVQIARDGQSQTSGQRKKVFKKAETKLVELVSVAVIVRFRR